MAENKTVETDADVDAFVAGVDNKTRRADAETLLAMMQRITGKAPKMWGPTIIGFDTYHYVYDSGREGDCQMVGVSPRKANLAIYIMPGFSAYQSYLDRLGKFKTGACCLYITRLQNVDLSVLEDLITQSYADMKAKYGAAAPH